jgi:hypothetical protein
MKSHIILLITIVLSGLFCQCNKYTCISKKNLNDLPEYGFYQSAKMLAPDTLKLTNFVFENIQRFDSTNWKSGNQVLHCY